jgi:glutaredoxin
MPTGHDSTTDRPLADGGGMDEQIEAIEFYWRPGCGFCALLERQLSRAGFELDKRNIWDEPEAAAYVRSVADGNETVPTVRIGPVALVNPEPEQVVAVLEQVAPHLLERGQGS